MLVDPQPLRNLCNWIASLRDLGQRVTLEIIVEMNFAHLGLLASKLGKKASTNLGAMHGSLIREGYEAPAIASSRVNLTKTSIKL